MLLQILDFIKLNKMVSKQQLCREFKLAESALEPMLEVWLNKALIQSMSNADGCKKSCSACKPQAIYYQFSGKPAPQTLQQTRVC